jgi:hypothetical integral membrane protein (TIGR02206 family)
VKFALFGALHLTIIALTVAIPAALSIWTRRSERPQIERILAAVVAAILVLDRVVILSLALHDGRIIHWAEALPMHLCDWAMIVVVVALLRGSQLTYELAYFWGLSGTVQAILTPDLADPFPSPYFISFFVSHCGIVVSVLFMTWGIGKRPLPGSIWRAVLWSQVYLVCAGVVDWLTGTNFGYLAAKPGHASLLDSFAPWPWYILELELASVLFYGIFYSPFWIADRRRHRLHLRSSTRTHSQ